MYKVMLSVYLWVSGALVLVLTVLLLFSFLRDWLGLDAAQAETPLLAYVALAGATGACAPRPE